MGILLNCATRQRIYLRAEHIFGRSSQADTLLDHPDASQLHASMRWTGRAWELRDHSRNGTLVDNHAITPEKPVLLTPGSVIEFGRHARSAWLVEDLAQPASVLWPLHEGGAVLHLRDVNVLPSEASREALIHVSPSGHWYCEQGGRTRALRDGDEVRMGQGSWCFISGTPVQATLELMPGHELHAAQALLHFNVSLDEEHVSLRLSDGHTAIDLGERTHHYCLLTLARRRLEDALRGIEAAAQGWVELDQLARMLGLDVQHLNIQIFRARKQLTQALPAAGASLPDIIERRRGAVRFGHWGVRIVRGSSLEGDFQPSGWSTTEMSSLLTA